MTLVGQDAGAGSASRAGDVAPYRQGIVAEAHRQRHGRQAQVHPLEQVERPRAPLQIVPVAVKTTCRNRAQQALLNAHSSGAFAKHFPKAHLPGSMRRSSA